MPLRKVNEVDRWIALEAPTATAQRVALQFMVQVGEVSWLSPSTPLGDLSSQPEYEVRHVKLSVPGETVPVEIWYRHFYANDDIDIIAVTNR